MILNTVSQGWVITVITGLISACFVIAIVKTLYGGRRNYNGVIKKPLLLSLPERDFFDTLCDALDYEFRVFSKVYVGELISVGPKQSQRQFQKLLSNMKNECFDYVICKKKDLSIVGVVELERFDSDISYAQKHKRSSLIRELCDASRLKLFYFDLRQSYLAVDIRRLITGTDSCTKNEPKCALEAESTWTGDLVTQSRHSLGESHSPSTCPDCNSELVTKMAMKGPHIGERFVMCRKYPYCEYRVSLKETTTSKAVSNEVAKPATASRSIPAEKVSRAARQAVKKNAQHREVFIHPHDRQNKRKGYSDWLG